MWSLDGNAMIHGSFCKSTRDSEMANTNWPICRKEEGRIGGSKFNPSAQNASLDAVVCSAVTSASVDSLVPIGEDDMVSWLQYPLDDSSYCSDLFDLSGSHVQIYKDPILEQSLARQDRSLSISASSEAPITEPEKGDVVQSDAGKSIQNPSANISKQFRWGSVPCSNSKSASITSSMITSSMTNATVSTTVSGSVAPVSAINNQPMLPPISHSSPALYSAPPKSGTMNFSHFSLPAAVAKANLHSLSKCGSLQQNKRKGSECSNSTESSIVESTTHRENHKGPCDLSQKVLPQHDAGGQHKWPSPKNGLPKEGDPTTSEDGLDGKSYTASIDLGRNLRDKSGATLRLDSQSGLEATEQTLTSSSGGSGNTAGRTRKGVATSGKRKARYVEESVECHSGDMEEETVDLKKSSNSRGVTKRSRAAEVHNLSERRRRDRINEKMRALQELIPNSNKTDKASMLDEAIEYLKMLQLQVQMMSVRTGMALPPMIIPNGMQHLPLPHMGSFSHMGMGLGMGMGMGLGFVDINGRPMLQNVGKPNFMPSASMPNVMPSVPSPNAVPPPTNIMPSVPSESKDRAIGNSCNPQIPSQHGHHAQRSPALSNDHQQNHTISGG